VMSQCQWELKVFKFKKYRNGYEDGKRRVAPIYPLEVEAFLASQGVSGALEHESPIAEMGASLRALLSDIALLMTGLPIDDAPTFGTSGHGITEDADLPTSSSEASKKGKVSI